MHDFGPETQSAQPEVSSPISDREENIIYSHTMQGSIKSHREENAMMKANLRRADMCSRQTGRIQNARRRQRNPQFEHRAVGKTEPRQCQSGSLWWPGQQLVLDLIK